MYPELFSIWGITVYTYGLFVAAGIITGLHLTLKLVKYRSLQKDFINYLFVGIVIFGFLGARAAYVLIAFEEYAGNLYRIFMFWEGGLVFFGGLIGGVVWVVFSSWRMGLNIWSVCDVFAPGIALGHAIGRIGCFFAGCCYGKPAKIGIAFTNSESLARPLGVPLHPTQLYSSVFLFILSGILYLKLKSGRSLKSSVFGLYVLCYSIFRIFIEFLRGDFRGELIAGFTPTQWIAFLGVALGVYLIRQTGANADVRG